MVCQTCKNDDKNEKMQQPLNVFFPEWHNFFLAGLILTEAQSFLTAIYFLQETSSVEERYWNEVDGKVAEK